MQEYIGQLFDLTGRTALVTGGGRGLGRSMAEALARAGADVAVTARSTDQLEAAARAIEGLGRRSLAITADVSNEQDAERAVAEVVEAWGHLDILVNAAGIIGRAPAHEFPVDDWRRIVDVNLTGAYLCSRAAANHMIPRKKGKIINIASFLIFLPLPGRTAYATSKGGMVTMTRSLAFEWAPYGIQVNAIAPGFFHTDINSALFERKEWVAKLVDHIPTGRPGKPEELHGALIFLASSASDYVNGAVLAVDGGQSAGNPL